MGKAFFLTGVSIFSRGAVSLYEDLVIADDSRVDDYVEQINKEIPQVHHVSQTVVT